MKSFIQSLALACFFFGFSVLASETSPLQLNLELGDTLKRTFNSITVKAQYRSTRDTIWCFTPSPIEGTNYKVFERTIRMVGPADQSILVKKSIRQCRSVLTAIIIEAAQDYERVTEFPSTRRVIHKIAPISVALFNNGNLSPSSSIYDLNCEYTANNKIHCYPTTEGYWVADQNQLTLRISP